MYLKYYLEQLSFPNIPPFLEKYLKVPCLLRLKKVGYFCGMDYASKNIYNFKEKITRYDHSLTVALLVYKLTRNKIETLAGLFHDVATPCFSHVIDYMNKDYLKQESTEEYTEKILMSDEYLQQCLKEDKIDIKDITDFKKYPVVDNDRPKVCADRIDGVILTGIAWTKNITKKDIKNIISDCKITINEYTEPEISFTQPNIVKKIVEVSKSIDIYCHSKEDNYMMELLAKITKIAITQKYINYDDLYYLDEDKLFTIMKSQKDEELASLIHTFQTIHLEDIPTITIPKVKIRDINPLIKDTRYKDLV